MDLSAFFESDLPVEEQKTEEFLAKLDEDEPVRNFVFEA